MEKEQGKTIVALTTENVKRVVAVHIEPGDASTVLIGGKNAAGKSSVLDSIMFAFGGAASIQEKPIRDGEEFARVEVDLGDIVVERVFVEGSSSVVVKTKDGAKYSSPQKLLDGMFSRLAFDPLEFAGMKPAEQSVALMELVGLSLDDIKAEADVITEQRREKNAELKLARSKAQAAKDGLEAVLGASEAMPEVRPDLEGARKAVEDARMAQRDERRDIEQAEALKLEVQGLQREIAELSDEKIGAQLADELADFVATSKTESTQLRERHEREQLELTERHQRECRNIEQAHDRQREHLVNSANERGEKAFQRREAIVAEIERKRKRSEELSVHPERKPIAELEDAVATAERLSRAFHLGEQYAAELETVKRLEDESDAFTKQLEGTAAKRRERIAATAFPIDGLSVSSDGGVLFNGIPFEQASTAQKIRTSVAIGLAANPKLKVLLIREGSLLDDDGLKLVADMATTAGAQIWIERVGDRDEGAIVIEDGVVRGVPVPSVTPPKQKRKKSEA